MPNRRSRPLRAAVAAAVVVLLLVVGGFLVYRHVRLSPGGCRAAGPQAVSLGTDQASIAATIAGVAHARGLPPAAVTIAYATAMQESKLHDLPSGDRDSVGVFQQRPSQGWGRPKQLTDPVYATGKFFAALVKVPNYLHIPLYQAAQDVQHSADGSAYMNYQQQAASMTGAFTGGRPHAVWCWYPAARSQTLDVTRMRRQMVRTFGRLDVQLDGQRSGGTLDASGWPTAAVRVRQRAAGWAVATWLVTHASEYEISNVRYAGYQWSEAAGNHGWTRDSSAPSGSVQLR